MTAVDITSNYSLFISLYIPAREDESSSRRRPLLRLPLGRHRTPTPKFRHLISKFKFMSAKKELLLAVPQKLQLLKSAGDLVRLNTRNEHARECAGESEEYPEL
ncbi:unnamed protein product [Aspergillus oryzae RIB40]|uniref:DNA, SC166 n=2 Tax=Aspergillus oryzae TaxID=5062 RepID=Q2U9L3_ASPOR|nr:unnamed protein product [Aspergillus oryzae RIB40]EIT81923.1 hypothetical protein Ao3042_01555 [Aspergillus oryzae 3.042]KDE84684.1 hypothetical protein AO1008_11279 [Aspergillus oryzae 100-8]BAE61752.1 unnamed protein product [Aspergillus oryzae RIB40]|eukprot:EIT81923.1 hypothetical protein Ao3042_01555 [Aspergillus oryzae 3.042]